MPHGCRLVRPQFALQRDILKFGGGLQNFDDHATWTKRWTCVPSKRVPQGWACQPSRTEYTTIQSTQCTLLLRAHKMTLFFHCVCPEGVFRPHHITICEVNSLINDKKLQGHKCCWYFIASCRLRLISGITIVPSAKSGLVRWGKRNAYS